MYTIIIYENFTPFANTLAKASRGGRDARASKIFE